MLWLETNLFQEEKYCSQERAKALRSPNFSTLCEKEPSIDWSIDSDVPSECSSHDMLEKNGMRRVSFAPDEGDDEYSLVPIMAGGTLISPLMSSSSLMRYKLSDSSLQRRIDRLSETYLKRQVERLPGSDLRRELERFSQISLNSKSSEQGLKSEASENISREHTKSLEISLRQSSKTSEKSVNNENSRHCSKKKVSKDSLRDQNSKSSQNGSEKWDRVSQSTPKGDHSYKERDDYGSQSSFKNQERASENSMKVPKSRSPDHESQSSVKKQERTSKNSLKASKGRSSDHGSQSSFKKQDRALRNGSKAPKNRSSDHSFEKYGSQSSFKKQDRASENSLKTPKNRSSDCSFEEYSSKKQDRASENSLKSPKKRSSDHTFEEQHDHGSQSSFKKHKEKVSETHLKTQKDKMSDNSLRKNSASHEGKKKSLTEVPSGSQQQRFNSINQLSPKLTPRSYPPPPPPTNLCHYVNSSTSGDQKLHRDKSLSHEESLVLHVRKKLLALKLQEKIRKQRNSRTRLLGVSSLTSSINSVSSAADKGENIKSEADEHMYSSAPNSDYLLCDDRSTPTMYYTPRESFHDHSPCPDDLELPLPPARKDSQISSNASLDQGSEVSISSSAPSFLIESSTQYCQCIGGGGNDDDVMNVSSKEEFKALVRELSESRDTSTTSNITIDSLGTGSFEDQVQRLSDVSLNQVDENWWKRIEDSYFYSSEGEKLLTDEEVSTGDERVDLEPEGENATSDDEKTYTEEEETCSEEELCSNDDTTEQKMDMDEEISDTDEDKTDVDEEVNSDKAKSNTGTVSPVANTSTFIKFKNILLGDLLDRLYPSESSDRRTEEETSASDLVSYGSGLASTDVSPTSSSDNTKSKELVLAESLDTVDQYFEECRSSSREEEMEKSMIASEQDTVDQDFEESSGDEKSSEQDTVDQDFEECRCSPKEEKIEESMIALEQDTELSGDEEMEKSSEQDTVDQDFEECRSSPKEEEIEESMIALEQNSGTCMSSFEELKNDESLIMSNQVSEMCKEMGKEDTSASASEQRCESVAIQISDDESVHGDPEDMDIDTTCFDPYDNMNRDELTFSELLLQEYPELGASLEVPQNSISSHEESYDSSEPMLPEWLLQSNLNTEEDSSTETSKHTDVGEKLAIPELIHIKNENARCEMSIPKLVHKDGDKLKCEGATGVCAAFEKEEEKWDSFGQNYRHVADTMGLEIYDKNTTGGRKTVAAAPLKLPEQSFEMENASGDEANNDKFIANFLHCATSLFENSHSALAQSIHTQCQGTVIKQSNISLELVLPTYDGRKESDSGIQRDGTNSRALTPSSDEKAGVIIQLNSSMTYSPMKDRAPEAKISMDWKV